MQSDLAIEREAIIWQESTTGLCSICLRPVEARIEQLGNDIFLKSTCPTHGEQTALLSRDADEYHRIRQYTPERVGGCCCGPEGCDTKPPVCVLLLEITQACNLRCPTCYADAKGHDFMSVDEAKGRLEKFFVFQPALDLLMISGGEPTIHPNFPEILEMCLKYPIGRILINTNGLRIAQNDTALNAIAAHRERVEIYLSFGSFRPEVHERLYGRDLVNDKTLAIERAGRAGVFVTLVPTVERGVNEDEIGELYRFALKHKNINGITFQPVMTAGRYENDHVPEDRLTMTDVLRLLQEQTSGQLVTTDFVGLPCSHPDCCSLTYGFLNKERTKLTPLPRHLDVARYMDLFSDRISFAGIVGGAIRRVWSDTIHFRGGQAIKDLSILFARSGMREALPWLRDPMLFGERVFRIVVKPFMDAHTYDHKRIDQCCTMILNEDGEAISFCEYNILHRSKPKFKSSIPLAIAGRS
ncbi:MAG: radical SAM protein [Chthonomonadales bacterium]